MTITDSRNCVFENAVFRQTEGCYLINIDHSANIDFSKCQITDNKAEGTDYSSIFDVSESENISAADCIVKNNSTEWFIFNSSGFRISNTPLDDNHFQQGDSYREQNPYSEYYDSINSINALHSLEKLAGKAGEYDWKDEYRKNVTALEKLQQNDDNYEVEYLLGQYYALGNEYNFDQTWDKAEECYKKAISLAPDSEDAHLALADLYFGACIDETEKFSRKNLDFIYTPEDRRSPFMEKALLEYLTAVKVADANVAPKVFYRILAICCFEGEFDLALQLTDKLVTWYPQDQSYRSCLKLARELSAKQTIPEQIKISVQE